MKKQLFIMGIVFMVMVLVPFVSGGITDLKWDLGSDWQHVHEDINFPCEGFRCCGEDWACDFTKGVCCDQEVEKTIEKEIPEFSFFDYRWESSHPTKENCGAAGRGGSGKCFLEYSGLIYEKCDLVNLVGESASHVDKQVYFCEEPLTLKFNCYQCGISYSVYPTSIKMDIYHKSFGSCDGFCEETIPNSYGKIGKLGWGCECYCKDGYNYKKQKKGEGLWECVKVGEEEDEEEEDEEKPKTVYIKAIRGDAEIDRGGKDEWVDAKKGMALTEGDYLATYFESEVDLAVGEHEFILREMTQIGIKDILEAATDPEKFRRFVIELRIGSVQATVKRKARITTDFKIVTPVATTAVRGTIFSVKHGDKTKITEVFVEEGEVIVTDKEEKNEVIVGKNEYTSVSEGQPPQKPIPASQIAKEDRWWEEIVSDVGKTDVKVEDVDHDKEEEGKTSYLWIIIGILIGGVAAYAVKKKLKGKKEKPKKVKKEESKKTEKVQKRKNPWVACFLNLLILGAGFWYLGKWLKGFLFLFTGIIITAFLPSIPPYPLILFMASYKLKVWIIILITAMVYSYKDAKKLNQEVK